MDPKRLVVIDGYSLLYRAFFATRYLSTADGRPTNALYGFTNMLFYLLENVKPDAVVVALDAPGKTFRHAEYVEYKGTRKDIQPELRVQLPIARELIAALGIPSIEVTGYEADDVVGTISCLAEQNGYHTTIVTGDLDTLQLVDECVSVLTMKMGVTDTITYGPDQVRERYGFGPELIPDYKAIVGDTSDNIPGVPGIGQKGATELIQKWGTIENLVEHFSEVEPKYQKKMEGLQEQMLKSKWLATIECEAPIEYDFRPFVLSPEQMEAAKAMMELYEFRGLLKRAPQVLGRYLDGAPREDREKAVVEVEGEQLSVSLTRGGYQEMAEVAGEGPFAAYFATLEAGGDDLFSEPVRAGYIAVGNRVVQGSEEDVLRLVQERPAQGIFHDAKATYKRLPIPTSQTPAFDTMLAGYVLQSGRTSYVLRDLVQGYLDIQMPTKPEEFAAALYLLEAPIADRLEREGQTRVLREVELPLVPILAEMEMLGICADAASLREFSKELEITIDKTQRHIHELAGQEFLIGSPKQLGEVLFEKLCIPGAQKTKTGYATGAEVLQELAPTHEICAEVLVWRELTKLKSTYADSLERLIGPDGRIHTTYSQTVAATGRLSSNDPNLQNIPIRTELGRGIRKAFHAGPGYQLASFDYSQIELRVLAHMCGEPALVRAFETGEDVHTVTAQQIFSLGSEPPTKEMRRLAKMLNYAVLYGVSEFGLAQQLGGGFSIAEARELINSYNERFPSVKGFTKSVVEEAKSKGFTTTLLGRRRYFPDIHVLKMNERRAAERQAMNAPIQGTAADMIKLAMIRVRALLGPLGAPASAGTETSPPFPAMDRARGGGQGGGESPIAHRSSRMLLTVHDELVFELAIGEEHLVEPIREAMEQALPLSVPVEVDAKLGPNWNEMSLVPRPVAV